MNPTWLYVGALYALAAWRARLPWRVAGLFYVLVLAFLFRPMTGDSVNIATDVVKLIPPWSASAPGFTKYDVSNFDTQDVTMQLVPWMHQVREAWRHGHLPLWNHLNACGYTLLGNGQAQALSPIRLLALPLPLKYAITAEGAMKILVALTFTFLYCRRRYEVVPSLVAAICFGFGPFVIVWLHFAIGTTAIWLPAVLYAIDLLAEKRTPARFAFAACVVPLVVFGGHPETGLHIAAFAIIYALVMDARAFPRFALAGIVGVLLALPLLVAMAEAIPQSFRYEQVKEWSREVPFSDAPSLALLVQPRIFGRQNPAGAESITGFAGILGIAAWLGVVASCLLPVASRAQTGNGQRTTGNRRMELFLAAAALFVFLVLANWHPATRVADVVFGLAANMRLRFLLAFALAVLTAALLDRVRGVPLIVGVVFAAAILAYVSFRFGFKVSAIPSAVVLLAVLPLRGRLAGFAVLAEIWLVTIGWNPVLPASTFYPRTPLIDDVVRLQARIGGIGPALFPNTNAVFGIEDVRFHDPMVPARYVHAMGLNAHDYYIKWTAIPDELNARWLLTADGHLTENPRAKPRFYSDDATVTITQARPTDYTLVIDAPKPARIMSSVGWARGWTPSKEGVFVNFDVPAGHHVVRVRYLPWHIYAAFGIALATAAALAAYIIRARV
jgi:hypothetical protein